MNSTQNTATSLREFIYRQFPLAKKRQLHDEDSLLESGILDSMGILDGVLFIENELGVVFSDDEVVSDNFDTIQSLSQFVDSKLTCSQCV